MTPRWTPHADLGTNERSGIVSEMDVGLEALDRLFDQALHTAGDDEGRERATKDRLLVLEWATRTARAALDSAMHRILDNRDEDEDGTEITQGATNAAALVAMCIVELDAALASSEGLRVARFRASRPPDEVVVTAGRREHRYVPDAAKGA